MKLFQAPHKRLNPLTGDWVLVSPHRARRPWQGQLENSETESRPAHDPGCYLCPGNTRTNGEENPRYGHTFVFDNDFAALLPGPMPTESLEDGLFVARPETGRCRVVCFSPRHDLSVPGMEVEDLARVIRLWMDECRQFREDPHIRYAQIFENKGEAMGCSNPHPHCQIWASSDLPEEVRKEDGRQAEYYSRHGTSMLLDYLAGEEAAGERLVIQNEDFVALVPFWATWPFETMILPRRPIGTIEELTEGELLNFARIYGDLARAYDALFDCEFPYSAGIHQAPLTDGDFSHWQMHMHFYPPLLRSATVKKFMVGYEMLGTAQRDITPETAADMLRSAAAKARVLP